MTAPLRKEWAAPKALCVCFQRSPDVDEHILSGLLDAAFHPSRNTLRVLANHFYTLENRLPQFVFFSRQSLEDCNFCHHVLETSISQKNRITGVQVRFSCGLIQYARLPNLFGRCFEACLTRLYPRQEYPTRDLHRAIGWRYFLNPRRLSLHPQP